MKCPRPECAYEWNTKVPFPAACPSCKQYVKYVALNETDMVALNIHEFRRWEIEGVLPLSSTQEDVSVMEALSPTLSTPVGD